MRKIILSTLFFMTMVCCFGQSANTKVCRLGFTYDISKNPNWGYHNLVITSVNSYSNAEKAGMQQDDIITHIEDIPVKELKLHEIEEMLNPINKNNVLLTVKSALHSARQIILNKECKFINAITEEQLAMAYNMYSLETTYQREFVCPFKTSVTKDTVDLAQFHSYKFANIDTGNNELESKINRFIEKEMNLKGYIHDSEQADLLIQTYYFFDKNPRYVGQNQIKIKRPNYRYSVTHNKMLKVPFLDISASESEAEYILQFGIRIIDLKLKADRVIWECEANELLEEAFKLDDYAQMHVPLMLKQFPYIRSNKNVKFSIEQNNYNYTGINYDMDKLSYVVSVDQNSPAYEAGIRPNDVIEGIEGQSTDYSIDEFTAAYRQFITNTMKYRNPKTIFTDKNGFTRCMYWDPFKYPEVHKAIQNPNNLSAFAYLFYFAPYINPTSNNSITFYVKQGEDRKKIIIRPSIRTCLKITYN